jgi:hypothetical protein
MTRGAPKANMVALTKRIRDISLVRGVRSVASRCAGMIGRVLGGISPCGDEVPHALKVEVLGLSFGNERYGSRQGNSRVSIRNLSVDLVERLTVSLTLNQDGVGSVFAVEHTCNVHVEPGDVVEVDLDLGDVPLDESGPHLVTQVRVVASRHVNKTVPTYVLPESSTGVCAIEEAVMLARDLVVQRIDISLSRNLLRNKGWARVMYMIRNDSGIPHNGLSLFTRFYSISGALVGEASEQVQVGPLRVNRVTSKVMLPHAGGLGATRFEAEFEGFEEIACGTAVYRGAEGIPVTESKGCEVWEGEEVKGAYWVDRVSR